MKSIHVTYWGSVLCRPALGLLAALLAACGGGGGSDTPAQVPKENVIDLPADITDGSFRACLQNAAQMFGWEDLGDATEIVCEAFTGDPGLQSLAGIESLENLETFETTGRKDPEKNIVSLQPLSNNIKLQRLRVDHHALTSLEGLENLTELEFLSLMGTAFSDLTPLVNLTGLIYLNLSDAQAGEPIRDASPLGNLYNLTELHLLGQEQLTSYDFLQSLQQLEVLSVSAGDDTVDPIEQLPNNADLKTLQVKGTFYSDPSAADLAALANINSLENLALEGKVRNIVFLQGVTASNLDISRIDDSSLDLTPLLSMPNLQKLNLAGAKYLSAGEQVAQNLEILSRLTSLTVLDIHEPWSVSAEDFSYFDVTALPNLTEFYFSPAPEFSRTIDPQTLQAMEQLRVLGVSGIRYEDNGEEHPLSFIQYFPNLEVIKIRQSDLGPLSNLELPATVKQVILPDNILSDSDCRELDALQRKYPLVEIETGEQCI